MTNQWKSRATCKRYFLILAAFVSLMFVSTAFAQVKPMRVFVIGNSFSQNATIYLPQLVKEGSYELEIGKAELGSCSLQTHWELAAAHEANPQGNKGRPYQGKSLEIFYQMVNGMSLPYNSTHAFREIVQVISLMQTAW